MVRDERSLIEYVKNPHKLGTKAYDHYEKIRGAVCVKDAKGHRATWWDLRKWYESGSIILSAGGIMAADAKNHDVRISDAEQIEKEENERMHADKKRIDGIYEASDRPDISSMDGGEGRMKDRSEEFKKKNDDMKDKRRIAVNEEHRKELSEKLRKVRDMISSLILLSYSGERKDSR